jgi:exodeoxyribonuclease V alpha subunit
VLAERVAWLLQSTADKEAGTQPAIPDLTATLTQLQAQNEVLCDGELICLPALATAEQELADDLLRRLARPPLPLDSLTLQGALVRAEQALGFALQGQQRAAVELALRVPLVVITGGPGTGKTTILRGLLAALTGMTPPPRVALAAPTGRAARRLAESTGLEARTLHRLLEFEPHTERFGRQRDHQLEVDWLVLDEVSMMEVPLAAAVVAALPATARLVLVGDADQLPSVGPGSVLADLLRAEAVPRVALQQVFRQGSQSLIPLAAQQVRQGLLPASATGPDGDFYHIVRETQEEIAAAVLEIVQQRLPKRGFDPVLDVQVLTPMHRGLLGTRQLGDLLGNALRPAQPGAALPGGFSAGDKVLQLRNDYDREVFNGDVGVVEGPGTPQSSGLGVVPTVTIRFGDRRLDLSADELDDITQAFVLTVHKSQGSEYPAVILPLHPSQHLMLQRNLLYTAITRARRFCVVVGPLRALQRAVQTDAPIARHTRLARLLGAPMLADRSDMLHD